MCVMTGMTRHAQERHWMATSGWLRAIVLAANDGILSTSSLVLGVAAGIGAVFGTTLRGARRSAPGWPC